MGARAIVLLTSSGRAGRLVAKYRPQVPVFAATNDIKVAHQSNANFGVIPLFLADPIKRVQQVVDSVVLYSNNTGILPVRDARLRTSQLAACSASRALADQEW